MNISHRPRFVSKTLFHFVTCVSWPRPRPRPRPQRPGTCQLFLSPTSHPDKRLLYRLNINLCCYLAPIQLILWNTTQNVPRFCGGVFIFNFSTPFKISWSISQYTCHYQSSRKFILLEFELWGELTLIISHSDQKWPTLKFLWGGYILQCRFNAGKLLSNVQLRIQVISVFN